MKPTLTKGSKIYFMYQGKPTEAEVYRIYPNSRPSAFYESKITTKGDTCGLNYGFREQQIGVDVFLTEAELPKTA